MPAIQAEPLLLADIRGFIPMLTITQQTFTSEGGTSQPPVQTTQTLGNVAFSAQFTFDGAKWALASGGIPAFPFQRYLENDPSDGQVTPTGDGIQTDEWMRGQMTLDLPTDVALDMTRDFIADRPANAISAPGFGGAAQIGYLEGSETIPTIGFDFGDTFELLSSGSFGYFPPTGPADPTVAAGRGRSHFFFLNIYQG